MRAWYREHHEFRHEELPPGLQRQLVVRGTLPRGLRARMVNCPVELERRLPPPPPGYVHVVIGGNLVLMNRRTFLVVDVAHF
jgi:Ni/Co efflux regulator RcnB